LIFGLPEGLEVDFRKELEQALVLDPEHISVYGLSVEPRTPLARWVSRGLTRPVSDERYATQFLMAHTQLTGSGFEHYEVSTYGKPGHRSRHNTAYWTGQRYAGLGPAAHSYTGDARSWNVDQWAEYERRVMEGVDPTAEREMLEAKAQRMERVYLGLRTSDGL